MNVLYFREAGSFLQNYENILRYSVAANLQFSKETKDFPHLWQHWGSISGSFMNALLDYVTTN